MNNMCFLSRIKLEEGNLTINMSVNVVASVQIQPYPADCIALQNLLKLIICIF